MTEYEPLADQEATTAVVIRDAVLAGTAPLEELEPGLIHGWRGPNGKIQIVDLTGDEYRKPAGMAPVWRAGSHHVFDAPSFAGLYQSWKVNGVSRIYADLDRRVFAAVLDEHAPTDKGDPAWRQHRVTYTPQLSPEWQRWTGLNSRYLDQVPFSEFLDDYLGDIAGTEKVPAGLLLDLAQHFTSKTTITFGSQKRLKDGQTQLQYVETTEAGGHGKSGDMIIPDEFHIAVPIFQDSDTVKVRVRLRYRQTQQKISFGLFFDNPDRAVRDAVRAIAAKIADLTKETIIFGSAGA